MEKGKYNISILIVDYIIQGHSNGIYEKNINAGK